MIAATTKSPALHRTRSLLAFTREAQRTTQAVIVIPLPEMKRETYNQSIAPRRCKTFRTLAVAIGSTKEPGIRLE